VKHLLIEEMKRAIEIMESKEQISKTKMVQLPGWDRPYPMVDRETSELCQLLRLIRKHSVTLEKGIR